MKDRKAFEGFSWLFKTNWEVRIFAKIEILSQALSFTFQTYTYQE